MKLYDDHFYCFGCLKHGDVTDMVGELFGISPKEAAEKIAHDFGISYDKQYGEYNSQVTFLLLHESVSDKKSTPRC